MPSTVLITGGAGYIGSWLSRLLLNSGHKVRVLDSLKFGGESLTGIASHPRFEFIKADLRDENVIANAVNGLDAIVHLAAIVGDPACQKFPEEAEELNKSASERLFQQASEAGVKHFVFASTCSNYGIMDDPEALLNEDSPLQPQSHYARLKVGFEEYLLAQTSGPAVTVLRFATAYGFSHRVRFDLTVNHFTRDLTLGKELLVFGKELWRPYGHCFDLARAAVRVLELGPDSLKNKVFNIGSSSENYTKAQIIDLVKNHVPELTVRYQDSDGGDLRNYKVDFFRMENELGLPLSKSLADGIREIHALVKSGLLEDPFAAHFGNS